MISSPMKNDERGFIAASIVNAVFGIILTLLALRFVFRFLGANPLNPFANFVYEFTQPLVAPFYGLFSIQAPLETARLELATIIALIVYAVIGGILAVALDGRRAHR